MFQYQGTIIKLKISKVIINKITVANLSEKYII